jgi:hypothetical protein
MDMADTLDPDADPFKPPPGSVLVHCIHCGEEYESYRIEWRVVEGPDGKHGFWCCPIEGCDGAGFGFDIYPVDAEVAAQFGIEMIDDEEADEDEFCEEEFDDLLPPPSPDDPQIDDEDIPY